MCFELSEHITDTRSHSELDAPQCSFLHRWKTAWEHFEGGRVGKRSLSFLENMYLHILPHVLLCILILSFKRTIYLCSSAQGSCRRMEAKSKGPVSQDYINRLYVSLL